MLQQPHCLVYRVTGHHIMVLGLGVHTGRGLQGGRGRLVLDIQWMLLLVLLGVQRLLLGVQRLLLGKLRLVLRVEPLLLLLEVGGLLLQLLWPGGWGRLMRV